MSVAEGLQKYIFIFDFQYSTTQLVGLDRYPDRHGREAAADVIPRPHRHQALHPHLKMMADLVQLKQKNPPLFRQQAVARFARTAASAFPPASIYQPT